MLVYLQTSMDCSRIIFQHLQDNNSNRCLCL